MICESESELLYDLRVVGVLVMLILFLGLFGKVACRFDEEGRLLVLQGEGWIVSECWCEDEIGCDEDADHDGFTPQQCDLDDTDPEKNPLAEYLDEEYPYVPAWDDLFINPP